MHIFSVSNTHAMIYHLLIKLEHAGINRDVLNPLEGICWLLICYFVDCFMSFYQRLIAYLIYIYTHLYVHWGLNWPSHVPLAVFSVLFTTVWIHSVLHGELRRGAGLVCLTEFEESRKEYTIQNGWILPDIHRNGCLSRWVYLSCFCVFSMCIAVKWFNGPSLLTHSWTSLYHIRSRIYIARSCIVYASHLVYISTGWQAA